MMEAFRALLERHDLPASQWESRYFSCPKEIFFLKEDFLRCYYAAAAIPGDHLGAVITFARKVEENPQLRHLAWYLYRLYLKAVPGEFKAFPETIDLLGEAETGLLYLIVQLTLIPVLEERTAKDGYPAKYAAAAATRIGTLIDFYAQAHHGLFGLRGISMPFMLNFREMSMFRIGRFDYTLEKLGGNFPFIYECDGERVIFAGDKWLIDADGNRVVDNTPGAWPTKLEITGNTVTGRVIDPRTGKVLERERTISLDEFHPVVKPGDVGLHFHIPGGGGMTPEKSRASFAEALEFYRKYFPEQQVKVIYSRSWIFNTAWLEYLPQSNLASLIRSGSLFPEINNGWEGLYFVFGRTDLDFDSYPRDNSMRRAMLDALKEKKRLYAPGWFIFPDEITN